MNPFFNELDKRAAKGTGSIENIPLEQEIIVNLALHEANRSYAVSELALDDFTDQDCKEIFESIITAFKNGNDFSFHSLDERQKGLLRSFNNARIGENISHKDIQLLKETGLRREYEIIAQRVLNRIQGGKLEEAKEEIGNFFILEDAGASKPLNVEEQNTFYLELIEKRKQGITGIPYPFKAIQNVTLGAQPGEMVLIAARPSVGKSAMLENIGFHQAQQGAKVLFCSAEMNQSEIQDRQIAHMMGTDSKKLKKGDVDIQKLKEVLTKRKNFDLWDLGSMTTLAIRSQIQRLKMTSGVDVVIIDYLQKLRGEGKSKYEKVSQISSDLKAIAVDFKIPVIVGCQYNREAADGQPSLSDMRDSGDIEQDSDVVISLWKDQEPKTDQSGEKIEVYVDILKNRNGRTFKNGYSLWFHEAQTKFYEMDEKHEVNKQDSEDIEI